MAFYVGAIVGQYGPVRWANKSPCVGHNQLEIAPLVVAFNLLRAHKMTDLLYLTHFVRSFIFLSTISFLPKPN